MAEWSNAVVLKTIEPKGSGGSNPSLSAICFAVARGGFERRRAADTSYSERIDASGFDGRSETTGDGAAIPLSPPSDVVG